MTMHGDVQAIYENGQLSIYEFGDGGNTCSTKDESVVFEEEYCGSWGWSHTVGKIIDNRLVVETETDRSNSIMGDTSSNENISSYDDIHDYIKKSGMKMEDPVAVIKCEASNLSDCYNVFHKYYSEITEVI